MPLKSPECISGRYCPIYGLMLFLCLAIGFSVARVMRAKKSLGLLFSLETHPFYGLKKPFLFCCEQADKSD